MKRIAAPASRPTGRARTALVLSAILLLALGVRVAHLVDIADSPYFTRPMIDGEAYDALALAIRAGTAPLRPYYQDPLYPYLLALVYLVFGHSYLAVYALQLLLGLAVTCFAFDTTRRLFDARAAAVAAVLAALYPVFIYYEGMIEKTALAVFLTSLAIWATVRSLQSDRWQWPALAGLGLGLAGLVRANLLAFAPLLILLHLLRGRRVPAHALVTAVTLAAVVGPVVIRNSVIAREPLATTTQAGQNFYIGNGPHNRTGQYEAPSWLRATPLFEETDLRAWAELREGRPLRYGELSRFYFRQSLDRLRAEPAAALRLLGRKTLLFFNRIEVPDNQDLGFFSRYSWVLRLPLPGFALVFCLGFAGLLLFFRRSAAHLALAAFFLLYAASVIAFFVLARYRLPAVTALLPFAGGMAVRLLDCRRDHRWRRLAAGVGLVLACLAPTLVPLRRPDRNHEHAQSLVNLAAVYCREGDTTAAVASLREALSLSPGHPRAAHTLGIIALNRGDQAAALELFGLATAGHPTDPAMHYHHGRSLEHYDRVDEALAAYRRSAEMNPAEPKYRFAVGTALQRLGRFEAALAVYDTLLFISPASAPVHHNRAVALYNLHRYPEAATELEAARRLGGPVNPEFERQLRSRLP